MFKSLEPLKFSEHQDLRFTPQSSFAFAGQVASVSLSFSELNHVSRYCPIIFGKDDVCLPKALFSIEGNTNVFVDASNNWTMPYIPVCIRLYPFALGIISGEEGQEDQFVLCVDPGADHFKSDQGEPLFNADKTPVDFVKNEILSSLTTYQNELGTTQNLFTRLAEQEVIVERALTFTQNGEEKSIGGFKGVDMEKLVTLDDKTIADMVKNGTMGMVYAHINSQANFTNLIRS
jgi:SapC